MTDQLTLATNDPVVGTTRTVPSGTNPVRDRAAAVGELQHAATELLSTLDLGPTASGRMPAKIAALRTALRRLRNAPEVRFDTELPDNGTETSKAAKVSAVVTAKSVKRKVLAVIVTRGGATDGEIEQALGMKHQTVSARRRDLVLTGHVVASGEVRDKSQVWIATDFGIATAAELDAADDGR